MDSLGKISLPTIPVRTAGTGSLAASVPAQPISQPTTDIGADMAAQANAAEIRREQAVALAASRLAERFFYPLGKGTFSLFKDVSGQLITRLTGPDGKVTYVPEPQLFEQTSAPAPVLNMEV